MTKKLLRLLGGTKALKPKDEQHECDPECLEFISAKNEVKNNSNPLYIILAIYQIIMPMTQKLTCHSNSIHAA